jgi:hypothetical protein
MEEGEGRRRRDEGGGRRMRRSDRTKSNILRHNQQRTNVRAAICHLGRDGLCQHEEAIA